ncbi:hypothetical protein PC129_g21493 [Phytophthora cactorum]|uniref:PH domain-containing protein n=1 Tax=Phytophthora cactorum TaxID=29920 RepID=A0A329RSU7_9STRA|nr:hypothetical protein Pcac1_g6737 [Phytophthora cactorum]KAG3207296.1 hypothetical protein PC129_g21493 [Phytophthora cactorum]RAW26616.1 hypothetical protein PC110_g16986 [Phytophthora cactorum]
MLVNGVDISMLEGWMIKINSNPSFFGKNMNRRWFKVGFVPGPGPEKKLVISYSTSKTAKDPRGWLYVEDVSGIYCRREMIEIVSPSRTLRLKGETAVEHRLWSDSLYKLCNPPPKAAPTVANTTPAAEPRRERTSQVQRETKQVDEEEEDRAKRKHRSDRERERERDRDRERERDDERNRGSRSARSNRRDDSDSEDRDYRRRDRDTRKRRSPSPTQRESRREERESSRRSPHREREDESISSSHSVSALRPRENGSSDDDSSEDGHDSSRPSTNSSTRSLLVAQIKSGSSFEDDMAQCKNVMSDSEEEDADDNHYEKKQADPEEESPREPYTSSTTPIDDDISHDELAQMIPEQMAIAQPSKSKNSEYFDSDEEEHEQPPSKINTVHNDRKAPVSSVTSDNNFVHDDWDAEDEPSSSQPTTKTPHSATRSGGVAADANFVHDDWDD